MTEQQTREQLIQGNNYIIRKNKQVNNKQMRNKQGSDKQMN